MNKVVRTIEDQTVWDLALQEQGELERLSEAIRKSTDIGRSYAQATDVTLSENETDLGDKFIRQQIKIATAEPRWHPRDSDEYFSHHNARMVEINTIPGDPNYGKITKIVDQGPAKMDLLLPSLTPSVYTVEGNAVDLWKPYLYAPNASVDGFRSEELPTQINLPYSRILLISPEDPDVVAGNQFIVDGFDTDVRSGVALIDVDGVQMNVVVNYGTERTFGPFSVELSSNSPILLVISVDQLGACSVYIAQTTSPLQQLGSTQNVGTDSFSGMSMFRDWDESNPAKELRLFEHIMYTDELTPTDDYAIKLEKYLRRKYRFEIPS